MRGGFRPMAMLEHRPTALAELAAWSVAVLAPWLMGRGLLLLVALDAARHRGKTLLGTLTAWDGAWYAQIARDGYGFVSSRGETPWPFFPFFPGVLYAAGRLGVPAAVTGVVVNHVLLLLALTGVWTIALRHGTQREALLASWSLALFPGTAALTLLYPDAIFLACCVWAFLAIEHERDTVAAVLAAIAAIARPNGAVLAASLGATALLAGGPSAQSLRRAARVMLPAAGCVLAWLAFLWERTGDPLVFANAKAAWHEVTLASLLAGRDVPPKLDLAPLAFAATVLAFAWRRLPPGWLVLAALALLPSLGLGMLGMPRYTAACFPVFVACGIVLARLPRGAATVVLGTFAFGLATLGLRVLRAEHMP